MTRARTPALLKQWMGTVKFKLSSQRFGNNITKLLGICVIRLLVTTDDSPQTSWGQL